MRAILALALLTACQRPEATIAVDNCARVQYEAECSEELLTPQEQQQCVEHARRQAMRLVAGIPASCR